LGTQNVVDVLIRLRRFFAKLMAAAVVVPDSVELPFELADADRAPSGFPEQWKQFSGRSEIRPEPLRKELVPASCVPGGRVVSLFGPLCRVFEPV